MPNQNYVIVGRDVDSPGFWRKPDGTPSEVDGPGFVPLNVEFVGELMVKLSKLGPDGVTPSDLADFENQVKHALSVEDFSATAGGAALTPQDKADILNNTTVEIKFETRDVASGPVDINTRILVVPADHTLELQELQLQDNLAVGFRPALTYDLDRALTLANFKMVILGMVQRFEDTNAAGWTADLQAALEAHMDGELDNAVANAAGPSAAANAILQSPKKDFHRSVGIYATNMCR